MKLSRRTFVSGATIALSAPAYLRMGLAQSAPIVIGSMTPLTGGGGPYGPEKSDAHRAVVAQVNAEGGVMGREVVLVSENSETNPEAAVRAARKLIDADGVSAIIGTWASSVTLGIMPLCQEADVLQLYSGSSDYLPDADLKGICFNLQPLNRAWAVALADLAVQRGFTDVGFAGPKNDFAASMGESFGESMQSLGGRISGEPFYYNPDQASYRAEAEQLIQMNAPALFIAGYITDFTPMFRELVRGGYTGQIFALSFAVGPEFKTAVGEAANGILHGSPVPPIGKDSYDAYLELVGLEPNGQVQASYGCMAYDEINLCLLGMEAAKSTEAAAVAAAIRDLANGPGERVTTFAEGKALIDTGTPMNYDGASSSVDFQPNGMLQSRDFALYEIEDGMDTILLTTTSSVTE